MAILATIINNIILIADIYLTEVANKFLIIIIGGTVVSKHLKQVINKFKQATVIISLEFA